MHTENTILLNQLGKRGERAFETIYWAYWSKLYNYAHNTLKDHTVCEDIVQTIFIELWHNRDKLKIENLNAYLFKAVKFQILNHIRSKKVIDKYLERMNSFASSNVTEEDIYLNDLQIHIDKYLQELPDRCQEVFYLSRFEHQSNSEISENLGISIKTVKNHITKARRYLQTCVSGAFLILISLIN